MIDQRYHSNISRRSYTYDGLGQTVALTLPDGASTTRYSYRGNQTTVTDPGRQVEDLHQRRIWKPGLRHRTKPRRRFFSETRTYSSLLQFTQMTVPGAMEMEYTYSTTQNNGRITQSSDSISGETVMYRYDTLNRLISAEATSSAWGTAYSYDGFGNLTAKTPTKGAAPSFSTNYDPATNRELGVDYDENGNPATDTLGGHAYDVENRILQATGNFTGWSYDHAGKRVFAIKQNPPSYSDTTCEIYFYGIAGNKLATYSCRYDDHDGGSGGFVYQLASRNLYFGGKLIRANGVTVVTDRLGSVRANSAGERFSYYPYGEERTSTADGREKFGTYFRDANGVDYADQRYYENRTGRFRTPDPLGIASNGFGTPSNWNRYTYAGADPINFADPTGRLAKGADGPCGTEGGRTDCDASDGTGVGGGIYWDPTGGGSGCISVVLDGLMFGFIPNPNAGCYAPMGQPEGEATAASDRVHGCPLCQAGGSSFSGSVRKP